MERGVLSPSLRIIGRSESQRLQLSKFRYSLRTDTYHHGPWVGIHVTSGKEYLAVRACHKGVDLTGGLVRHHHVRFGILSSFATSEFPETGALCIRPGQVGFTAGERLQIENSRELGHVGQFKPNALKGRRVAFAIAGVCGSPPNIPALKPTEIPNRSDPQHQILARSMLQTGQDGDRCVVRFMRLDDPPHVTLGELMDRRLEPIAGLKCCRPLQIWCFDLEAGTVVFVALAFHKHGACGVVTDFLAMRLDGGSIWATARSGTAIQADSTIPTGDHYKHAIS